MEQMRKMSRLAIVRHGEYGSDKKLNDLGRSQMQKLGGVLKESLTEGEVALILSSTAPRALESAEILANILKASVEQHEILWSGVGRPEDLEGAYELVQSLRERTNLGILVTHYEYTEWFPDFIGEKDLNVNFPVRVIGKGEALIIDYRSKKITYLR